LLGAHPVFNYSHLCRVLQLRGHNQGMKDFDGIKSRLADKGFELRKADGRIYFIDKTGGTSKILTFDPEGGFLGWLCLLYYQGTVFEMAVVRYVLIGTVSIGLAVATLVSNFDIPKTFNTDPFSKLLQFLMVFLAFMTGLFVTGAFARWQQILKNLFDIVDSVKCLFTEAVVQGVPAESISDVRRWGLLSVYIAARGAPQTWDPVNWDQDLQYLLQDGMVTEDELNRLAVQDGNKSSLTWCWIVMKLRELSEQGLAPARQTPAMVRMLDHCHQAITALGTVSNLTLFQVPHQVLHMLGFLIHLYNILVAIKCGIDVGLEIGQARAMATSSGFYLPDAMLGQKIFVNIFFILLGPMIYQAFLAISADILIPFGSGSTDLPVRYLLDQFQHELSEMEEFFKNPSQGASLKDARQAG